MTKTEERIISSIDAQKDDLIKFFQSLIRCKRCLRMRIRMRFI